MIYALEMTIFATLPHTFRDRVRHQFHQAGAAEVGAGLVLAI